jgi:hypothetical protein
MTIQTNLSTLGAIQVPPSVLRTFYHLLDHYQFFSQKPIGDNNPTSIIPLMKSIIQQGVINVIQVETLLKKSEACIKSVLAFQELTLELATRIESADHIYLSNWITVRGFLMESSSNK